MIVGMAYRTHLTNTHKKRISSSLRGHGVSQETREKIGRANTKPSVDLTCLQCQKHFSVIMAREKTAKYCSRKCRVNSLVGKPGPRLGVKYSDELRSKLSKSHIGKNLGALNHFWKGGVSLTKLNERRIAMRTPRYKLWRRTVMSRDGYKCVWCGAKNGGGYRVRLEVDHIKRWVDFPLLRYNLSNGRTLCRPCHVTTFSNLS